MRVVVSLVSLAVLGLAITLGGSLAALAEKPPQPPAPKFTPPPKVEPSIKNQPRPKVEPIRKEEPRPLEKPQPVSPAKEPASQPRTNRTPTTTTDPGKRDPHHISYSVDGYRVLFFGKSNRGTKTRAWLYLYSKQNKTGVGGAIGFYEPEDLENMQDYVDALDRPQGHMPIAELPAVLSMLQNSTHPVRVFYTGGSWKTTFLQSGEKPLTLEEVEMFLDTSGID
ncbi:MAG: hypothetical protein RIC55_27370 [Pirellulaceae bacterium]